ncbi:hypothetical protein C8F04DRAFT_222888 [Mycena alexandri]|uniref:Uncharacterized protein n=1 Tax=Mycena alexandri TaxID=1745969 RepID=A0AAD6XJB3_9AGAR|nr:hypothetical protein C8F04DRAFT_222888 [Mycena alexandri]
MLHAFEVAADKIVDIIDTERTDASEVYRQQLEHTQNQCNQFRNAAYATHAANENINARCRQEIDSLTRVIQDMQYTLNKAGIYYHMGRLAFGGNWGAVVRALRPSSPNLPQGPFLFPRDVVAALEAQREAEHWRRERDSAEIARLQHLVKWHQQTTLNGGGAPLVESKPMKRAAPELTGCAVKRSRLDIPLEKICIATPPFTATSSNCQSPAFSPMTLVSPIVLPTPPFQSTPPSTTYPVTFADNTPPPPPLPDLPAAAPPVIDRWQCTLAELGETKTPRQCVLPPLVAFVAAHACNYYWWFFLRTTLFTRLSDPGSSVGRSASTPGQWELRLFNKMGKTDHVYSEKFFDNFGIRCACGMPSFHSEVLRKIPHRSDGTAIEPADFDSPALQALMCTDLELAHVKLQFEQTDDILLEIQSWTLQERTDRLDARTAIFRNSWDLSFASVPLEASDILARRPWIINFGDLLRDWPNFGSMVPFTVPHSEDDTDPLNLDSLASFEQALITFYLQTVSDTLGIHPARPRQRPDVDALPQLYRSLTFPLLSS